MNARILRFGALATAAFLLAGALQADTLKLKNGERLEGRPLAYDAQTRTLRFLVDGGAERQLSVDELDARSYYLVVRSKVEKDNAQGQLQLANFARDAGLYSHSARNYRQALAADPSLEAEVDKEVAVLRRQAGAWAMGKVHEALGKNDIAEAERWLTKIVQKLPDEPVAKEAAGMLDRYHAQVREAKDDELEQKHAELLKKELSGAKKAYDELIAKDREGLTSDGSGSKRVRSWEAAITAGKRAQRELDRFAKKHDEPELVEAVAGYKKVVDEQLVQAYMNLGSYYTSRSSYDDALKQANQALAIDPKNSQALAMRARIEEASSQGIGWGWGWRRRR